MDPEIVKQLQQQSEQIQYLQQQLAVQEIKINTVKATKFDLTSDQIIRNFNEISSFSGEDNYKLKSFLKTVEDVENLCGQNNEELKQYCLRKLINNKIIGNARNTIMEIPDQHRNWTNVVQQLRLRFRPKSSIHQLLYKAKEVKVFNLKDTFNKLNKIKSECSEICDFDDEDNFTYFSIDKELVQILKSKIIPLVQLQVDTNKSLFELDNIFCKSEIYLSEDIIKIEFRINQNKELNFKTNRNYFQNKNRYNNNNVDYRNNYNNNGNNNNRYNNNNNDYKNNNSNNNRYNNNTNTSNNNYNNSGQFKTQHNRHNELNLGQFKHNEPNSGQFRQSFNNNKTGQYRRPETMEVDNINEVNPLNQEVNFIDPTPSTSYR